MKSRSREIVQWQGPSKRYDIVKEFVVALTVVAILTLALSALFSSPDEPSLTIKSWANTSSEDFVLAAATELDGSSPSASYGPPYFAIPGSGQKIGPVNLQALAGVRTPVNSANAFVIDPLRAWPNPSSSLTFALGAWARASPDQQQQWASAYVQALGETKQLKATGAADKYGPVPELTSSLLVMAKSGALDGVVALGSNFYQTNYTHSLLFMGDGTYLEDAAVKQNLGGDQSGMMNETGSYPGQAWLWLYTFWYQIPPFSNEATTIGANADAVVWGIMMLLSLLLLLVPFLPGIRSIPRWIPLYRIIWRQWYRNHPMPGK